MDDTNELEDGKQDSQVSFSKRCTSYEWWNSILTYVLLLVLSWAVPWSILGDECLPGSNIFGIIILTLCCVLAGVLVHAIPIPKLPPLPPLLGMLLAGFALRNIPGMDMVITAIQPSWSSTLRSLALTVILVKAGLELDASALKKMKGVCLRLTALPCLVESVACAVACYLLLGFSWEWGFLLGFVLGAVTPAVIVPSLLTLQQKGLGVKKGIPTLVIAASSFDDVLAISGFSVVLGITFSSVSSVSMADPTTSPLNTTTPALLNSSTTITTLAQPDGKSAGEIALMIFRGPLEMLGGITVGIILGIIMWYFPSSKQKNLIRTRSLLVVGLGILAVFGSRAANFPGAGALAAIVAPFVAAFRWKESKEPVSKFVGSLWSIFEPVMFGLIGAEISITEMDGGSVALGIAVLMIGLLFRTLTTFGAVTFAGLSFKEKLFVCFAWIPKATVQAALGPVASDIAKESGASEEVLNIAKQVLTIAVLSILITSPLGAAAIGLSGPKLLKEPKLEHELPLNDVGIVENQEQNDESKPIKEES
uniref:Sodium/hydrogen exchanger 9B2-like n=1 Tax=Ciona intestinalis TaxID=7719 RepID=F6Q6E0_CIOIN|nr:sodium/hydrogen exchanger 9B2-like [Ciona intestinalis]|eukprot:XP_002128513.1 sodium/hydrogen exchanger 9B2-like [Ciona intestinalis]